MVVLKKILMSLSLIISLVQPSLANELTQFPTTLMCTDQKGLSQTITEFEEISFAGGVAMRDVPGVGLVKNNLVIFVSPKNKSWTIVERFNKDLYCVVALGEGFRLLNNQ